eukprot:403366496
MKRQVSSSQTKSKQAYQTNKQTLAQEQSQKCTSQLYSSILENISNMQIASQPKSTVKRMQPSQYNYNTVQASSQMSMNKMQKSRSSAYASVSYKTQTQNQVEQRLLQNKFVNTNGNALSPVYQSCTNLYGGNSQHHNYQQKESSKMSQSSSVQNNQYRVMSSNQSHHHSKQVSSMSILSNKSNQENLNNYELNNDRKQQQIKAQKTNVQKLVNQKRKQQANQCNNLNEIQEGDEFSLIEERLEDESIIQCRHLPTLTHLKLYISPKPDLRYSIASRKSNQNSRRQSSVKRGSQFQNDVQPYIPRGAPLQVVVHLGSRYTDQQNQLLQQSSFDESSCFFDEINKDEDVLHQCASVHDYEFWPKIVSQLTISLNPQKNEKAKQKLNLNNFITKVPQSNIQTKYKSGYLKKEPTIISEQDNEDTYGDEIPQQNLTAQNQDLHKSHLIHTLQSLQYIKQVPLPLKYEVDKKGVYLPKPKNQQIKKTVVFDLDETLIHCVEDPETQTTDIVLEVIFPNGEVADAGINVRPYAIECLKEAGKYFQVVVFTASHQAYADVVLDYLDPTHSLIEHRLYRDSCMQTEEGVYIKDLRIIKNRNIKDIVIVDNAVYSFGFQLDNGIPILPFYEDKADEELLHLIYYLKCLSQFEDIREQNRKAFQLQELEKSNINEFLESFCSQQNSPTKNSGKKDYTQNNKKKMSVISENSHQSSQSQVQSKDSSVNQSYRHSKVLANTIKRLI